MCVAGRGLRVSVYVGSGRRCWLYEWLYGQREPAPRGGSRALTYQAEPAEIDPVFGGRGRGELRYTDGRSGSRADLGWPA